jgi:hypothetical protein
MKKQKGSLEAEQVKEAEMVLGSRNGPWKQNLIKKQKWSLEAELDEEELDEIEVVET